MEEESFQQLIPVLSQTCSRKSSLLLKWAFPWEERRLVRILRGLQGSSERENGFGNGLPQRDVYSSVASLIERQEEDEDQAGERLKTSLTMCEKHVAR